MNAGQLQTLKELIEFLKQNEVGEFELEQEDIKVTLRFAGRTGAESAGKVDVAQLANLFQAMPHASSAAATPALHPEPQSALPSVSAQAQPPAAPSTPPDEDAGLHIVKSPIVGTFYEAASPGAAIFVKVGDQVESGQVICIIEAMKLMNEIESDASGEVVKRFVTNSQPVEYGQALFAIRPR